MTLSPKELTKWLIADNVTDYKAILLAYVRFIKNSKEMVQELLFAKSLITNTKGSSIIYQKLNYEFLF
jgi:hypothetical protein